MSLKVVILQTLRSNKLITRAIDCQQAACFLKQPLEKPFVFFKLTPRFPSPPSHQNPPVLDAYSTVVCQIILFCQH